MVIKWLILVIRLSAKPQLHLEVACLPVAAVRRPLICFFPFACADLNNRTNLSKDLSIVYLNRLFLEITSIRYIFLFLSAAYNRIARQVWF